MSDEDVKSTRRKVLQLSPIALLGALSAFDKDGDGSIIDDLLGQEEQRRLDIFLLDENDEPEDIDVQLGRAVLDRTTHVLYIPDDNHNEWVALDTTGKNPSFDSAVVGNLQTENIGVSASIGTNQTVETGTETRLEVSNTSPPYFDDFNELNSDRNKVTLKHPSHHVITAHADLGGASAGGQVWLRIYVNGEIRTRDHIDIKNGEDGVLECSINLKLDKGDEVTATVEHDTGVTETFTADDGGNFLSVIRQ